MILLERKLYGIDESGTIHFKAGADLFAIQLAFRYFLLHFFPRHRHDIFSALT